MKGNRTRAEHGPRHVVPASRSVFHDLGFDEAEARVLEMRADLMAALRAHIEKHGSTQSEAAQRLGTTRPRVSELMKGALPDFSADMSLVSAARVGLRPTEVGGVAITDPTACVSVGVKHLARFP